MNTVKGRVIEQHLLNVEKNTLRELIEHQQESHHMKAPRAVVNVKMKNYRRIDGANVLIWEEGSVGWEPRLWNYERQPNN